MHAFHENPNMFLSSTKLFEVLLINIVDPDQTAPEGAV